MEATWMSIDKWIDQEDVVQICNGILLSHKKEQMWISWTAVEETRICYTSEVSQKEKNKYRILTHIYGSDQIRSVSQSCPTLCDPMGCKRARLPCPSLSPRVCSYSCPFSWWFRPTIILCRLLLLLSSLFLSIEVFSSEFHIRWQTYWSFSFSPSTEMTELMYFRIDWFDLPAVPGPLRSLL